VNTRVTLCGKGSRPICGRRSTHLGRLTGTIRLERARRPGRSAASIGHCEWVPGFRSRAAGAVIIVGSHERRD